MIYLDYQATTPLAPEARDAMLPWLAGPGETGFANPHSPHAPGRAAAAAIEHARVQVAKLLPPGGQVIFTASGCEAVSLALIGSGARRIALSTIEHAAVIEGAKASGAELHWLEPGRDGIVPADTPIPAGVDLVAVMQVNNEIGTTQPVDGLAASARKAGARFLCDAVQGAGKYAPPAGADFIAITAHKLYGPKGIGALWVRDGIALSPVIHGGGQQFGVRSGTLSPALCAGFGAAAALTDERREADAAHVGRLWDVALETLGGWTLNGSTKDRWRGNVSVRREGLDVGRLMSELRGVAFSAGSACASGTGEPSHVLRAIGLSPDQAKSTIRIGFGRYTTQSELREGCELLNAAAAAQGAFA